MENVIILSLIVIISVLIGIRYLVKLIDDFDDSENYK